MNDDVLSSVAITQIVSNRYQPRALFCDDEIRELAESIAEVGLLHPPLVRPILGSGDFEIISGERRVMACRFLKYTEIQVVIRANVTHSLSAKAALIENMQRVDLNAIEIAKAILQLINEFGCTQEEIAQTIGKKRSTVANFLRLLHLPKSIQEAIQSGAISMAHAKVLLSCPLEKRIDLFVAMQKDAISVRQAEKLVQSYLKNSVKKDMSSDMYAKDLERRLERYFGAKVEIQAVKNRGKVSIHFYDLDDLDRIVELFNT